MYVTKMSTPIAMKPETSTAADPVLLARLAKFIGAGAERPGFLARGPIDRAAIRQMTDAVGDRNPIYTDEEFARGTIHNGLVAPPLWLSCWLMHGLRPGDEETTLEDGTAWFHLAPSGQRQPPKETRTIRDELNDLLAEYGYTSPAVTNIAHSYLRYLRPGERPRFSSWIIEDIVGPKTTKLGEGFFMSQKMNVFVDNELVATIRQRNLRSKPATREPGKAAARDGADKPRVVTGEVTAEAAGEPVVRSGPARPRTTTLRFDQVKAGDVLPPLVVKISPTLIIAGALASQDFQDVHHDYPIMQRRGHPHIFMNAMTTSGLLGRFVTDWTGPEALVREYEMQLLRPNYPGDTMRLTGTVRSAVATDGRGLVTVDLLGTNSLGRHTQGSVCVELPMQGGR